MKYQLFPNLTADEFEALTADIKARGVMVPVEIDETGAVLDGHHRVMIADSLGIPYPTVTREGWTEAEKIVHVIALNAHRRHLTPVERAEVVAQLRKAKLSTRAIAKAVGVGKDTVRRDLAHGADAPPETVTGTDGKSYPAVQPARPRIEAADPILAKRAAATPPVRDYIEDMPPAEQEWERSFRTVARWSKGIHAAAVTLTGLSPERVIPTLDQDERRDAEETLGLIRDWAAAALGALAKDAPLHLVGGSR